MLIDRNQEINVNHIQNTSYPKQVPKLVIFSSLIGMKVEFVGIEYDDLSNECN